MEQGLTKQRIVAELSKSPHGSLKEYVPIGQQAVKQEGEFAAHLIAWNHKVGQIRDSKVALPVIGLAYENDAELLDNAFAHLALLGPRELLRAFYFARELRPSGKMVKLRQLIGDYLHEKEQDKGWDHIAIQHRKTLKELYSLGHVLPEKDRTHAVLWGFKGKGDNKVLLPVPKGSVFEVVANLKNMSPTEAAGSIMKYRIPFLIAMGALGAKAKEPDLVLALIGAMSATELTTNVKMLEKLGLKTNPALRGAFDAALLKASTSKKNTLKTTQAVEAVQDEGLKEKLRGLQAKQISAAGGPEGDWVILADKSGSMSHAIETACHIAGSLTQFVKGKVGLIFFDKSPTAMDVTGLSLDQIKVKTRHVRANGGTSIGCGLNSMLMSKVAVDGIVVVSDGGENSPPLFSDTYAKYSKFVDKDVPVYFYQLSGESDSFSPRMKAAGIEMQTFDLRGQKLDYYSIPNTVKSLNANPYSLVDEILQTPLLTLNQVLKSHGKAVLATA
jgi:Mg-chelatase subunit ChlD